jgi:alpha-amylase
MPANTTRKHVFAMVCLGLLSLWSAASAEDFTARKQNIGPVAVTRPESTLPDGWHHGAFVEIFVRAYQDSNDDGIGDLRGITQRLDYLKDLGIKGIWLMPINPSEDGDHGYAVMDYRAIEPAYGTMADFDELIEQAHARGIGVIMDYVINHSAAKHPLFIEAASSAQSPYRDWYVWQPTIPKGWNIFGANPWHQAPHGAYLAQFNPSMPDFNFANPDVKKFHLDNMRFWLNRGIDGFRFDAVTHLVENGPKGWYDQAGSYVVMGELRAELAAHYRNRYFVCEATSGVEKYASPEVCGRAFAFGYQYDVVNAARGKPKAIKNVAKFFNSTRPELATMISNHDLFAGERAWDQFKGNQAQYRLAAATYLLQPGTPFIYYGEEVGMSAHPSLQGDPKLRVPMSWTADVNNTGFSQAKPFRGFAANSQQQNVELQRQQADALHAFYVDLLKLRNRYPSLSRGSYKHAFTHGKTMGFQREWQGERALVLINYGVNDQAITVKNLAAATQLQSQYPADGINVKVNDAGAAKVVLKPQSVQVFIQNFIVGGPSGPNK